MIFFFLVFFFLLNSIHYSFFFLIILFFLIFILMLLGCIRTFYFIFICLSSIIKFVLVIFSDRVFRAMTCISYTFIFRTMACIATVRKYVVFAPIGH